MSRNDSAPNRKRDYEIGYGRPPKGNQFKKGQSGNPSGRRRYSETGRAQQLIRQELYRTITVREGSKVIRMPAVRAILRKQILLAAQGNVSAMKEVLKALRLIEAAENVQPTHLTHEEALDMLDQPDRGEATGEG
jgi:hypothetical protein